MKDSTRKVLDWILPCVLGGVLLLEGVTFAGNSFHVPASQLPLRLFGLQVDKSSDATMAPAVAEGEHLLVTAWPYRHGDPVAGDVVVLAYPRDPSVLELRRVIAAGPATVEIRDGQVQVDGQALAEPWMHGRVPRAWRSQYMPARAVPAGCYFVLGDNRDLSSDSREWGCVARDHIYARRW